MRGEKLRSIDYNKCFYSPTSPIDLILNILFAASVALTSRSQSQIAECDVEITDSLLYFSGERAPWQSCT
jgi:hypothetical protein